MGFVLTKQGVQQPPFLRMVLISQCTLQPNSIAFVLIGLAGFGLNDLFTN